jgi:CRISPR/Cas system endoribonuclease Cas6 (RAMP superfamily)
MRPQIKGLVLEKELSLLKAPSAKQRSKFTALSPVMVSTAKYNLKIAQADTNKQSFMCHF